MQLLIAALLLFSEGTNHQKESLQYIAEATQTPYSKVVVFYLNNGYTDETYDHFNKEIAEEETGHYFGDE